VGTCPGGTAKTFLLVPAPIPLAAAFPEARRKMYRPFVNVSGHAKSLDYMDSFHQMVLIGCKRIEGPSALCRHGQSGPRPWPLTGENQNPRAAVYAKREARRMQHHESQRPRLDK
jgi:hypothetical protein